MLDFGFYNMDCMEGMKEFPDDYFDLAIVDPPYGAGFTETGGCKGWFSKYHQDAENPENSRGGEVLEPIRTEVRQIQTHYQRKNCRKPDGTWGYANWRMGDNSDKKIITWDVAPGREYFEELFRVSRNQIIWGGITLIYHRQDAF